jgi:hypothetical protein
MSSQITVAFVEQYSANVEYLAQQMNSRFTGKVRMETQRGKSKFYEQIGATAAVKITSRHQDTPRVDTNHQRRATYLNQYVWSDLIDELDQVELLIDPTSAYAQNAAMAFNRAKDDEIIAAATGTAYADTGSGNGTVSAVTLPSSQAIVVSYTATGTGANSGLTLAKLIQAKSILSAAEYPEGSKLYLAHKQRQLDNLLLNVTQVSDIHTSQVKALVAGEVNHFLGLEFVRSQRLATASSVATCFAWVESGLLMAVGQDAKGRVGERPDKNYSTQVFMNMSIGATRMQEAYVVSVACDETTAA